MTEKAIGQASGQRLPGAIHHEHDVRHLGQSRVTPLSEGNNLVPVLPGMVHIVQHRPCFAALADGKHHRGSFRAVRQVVGITEEHIIVEMHIIEYQEGGADKILDYADRPSFCLYSSGLSPPRDI